MCMYASICMCSYVRAGAPWCTCIGLRESLSLSLCLANHLRLGPLAGCWWVHQLSWPVDSQGSPVFTSQLLAGSPWATVCGFCRFKIRPSPRKQALHSLSHLPITRSCVSTRWRPPGHGSVTAMEGKGRQLANQKSWPRNFLFHPQRNHSNKRQLQRPKCCS